MGRRLGMSEEILKSRIGEGHIFEKKMKNMACLKN
jgi:hypothetical protein